MLISDGPGIRNWIFGYPGINRKMSLMQDEPGFSSFFAIFDDFAKICSDLGLLHFEKSSIMAKKCVNKMKKSLVQLAFKNTRHFQNPVFRYDPVTTILRKVHTLQK